MLGLNDTARHCLVVAFLRVAGELIVEDIGEALVEDQRQDEVPELRRIGGPPDGAGHIPQSRLELANIHMLIV